MNNLKNIDIEIYNIIEKERIRQEEGIELIASENFTSKAVMIAQGSILTNKYAEGYPAKRWYGGCEFVDDIEKIAIDRAKQLFNTKEAIVEHVNVQPHSGSSANMAVYFAMLKQGDKMLTMDLSHGGHLTHGNKANFSGKFFNIIHYGVDKTTGLINYDELLEIAEREKPKMITVGASAYSRIIDFSLMGKIATKVNALLLADIAHIAGLVATNNHPSPIPYADFVTTTTHKTLRGPRGGIIMCKSKYAKEIDAMVFPGIQGGPLMHIIAAKAVCFYEALQPEFIIYQKQVIKNAYILAEGLKNHGYKIISEGTDNHLVLIDVSVKGLTGKECQTALDLAGITINKNTIPFDTKSPFNASGIRLGTPAITTRGMKETEVKIIVKLIDKVLNNINDDIIIKNVRNQIKELAVNFPLLY